MTYQERRKELIEFLFKKYDSMNLTRVQAAESLKKSTATLDRIRKAGLGPRYYKDEKNSKNGMVRYPIEAIADHILSTQVQTT